MQEQEMINDLILESKDHLEAIEPDLLELEQKGDKVSDELINRVFRSVHSIKGGFGFFGMKNIVALSHTMEAVMSRVREHSIPVTPLLVEALLRGIDKLRVMLDDVSKSDALSFADEQALLQPFLSPTVEKNSRKAPEDDPLMEEMLEIRKKHPTFSEDIMFEALRNGKLVYRITIGHGSELIGKNRTIRQLFEQWEKFGQVADCAPPIEKIEKSRRQSHEDISVLYTTALEADLLSEALGIAVDDFIAIDLKPFKEKITKTPASLDDSRFATKGGAPTAESAADSKIEDALRVKINLLNNLMNYAGELVLARNQLLQIATRRFSEFPKASAITKNVIEWVRTYLRKAGESQRGATAPATAGTDADLSGLEKRLMTELSFPINEIQGINSIVQNLDMVTTMLQEGIMQTRLQPLAVVFSKFPRVIRDLARKLGKEINLTQIGQDVELDKSIIEQLSDPLTHLVRNSVDHGIEPPAIRAQSGKSKTGTVILKARQEGGKVIIEIIDDGAGINIETVKAKAVEKGMLSREAAAEMPDKEAQMLIFLPGFSTAREVTDLSGRGVGMDVVKTNIERLGGTVEVQSETGQGTTMTLKLPLTLAIIPSLIVTSENRRFAIPQVGLEEIVRIRAKDLTKKVERVYNAEVLRLRGKLLPLVRLSHVLGIESTFVKKTTLERSEDKRERWSDRRSRSAEESDKPESDIRRQSKSDRRESTANAIKVIVLRTEKNLFGLVVDDVHDSEEIVVKPLPEYLKASQCYAGATIMGDGRVAMILDSNGIAAMAQLRFTDIEQEDEAEKERAAREERRVIENVLLFSVGGPELLGVNLSSVARVEKRKRTEIERIGEKEFLTYDDYTMRLFRLERYLPIQPAAETPEAIFILVPKTARHQVGFVITRVEDAVQTELKLETHSLKSPGINGSALINKKMTVVVNMGELIDTVEKDL